MKKVFSVHRLNTSVCIFFFFQSVFSVWFDIEKQNKLEYYKKKPVSKISEEHLLTATCMQSEV